ncbi:flavin monoamine oxidase family protein [Streptomyces griseorubiginosus]|uniref:Monoamine oxidase n=1 Tax=Streptomyces griseorubiginosus TaxID=67304 RepID=A0A101RSU1_9ACTN|nr:FAD-dependent oxidoreductase [Streptomyces griseorubiginosus]AYC44088.1 Putative flavin-containing monoamine oxidase AofH [Streptomyces griseorubiginosus]KUM67620.1 monoamine oxidase [Streptomyces griseorubiginosus]KUN61100.1 monoamine oxidase [Streptomyces griseorubiginosus]
MNDHWSHKSDVVVIGAGLAGLSAARDLVAAGKSVAVLEARDRVGGRLLNHDLGDGQVTEIGGQFVGPTQDRILALAKDVGVETYRAEVPGENVYVHDGRSKRFSGHTPPDLLALPDMGIALARIGKAAARIDPAAPWKAPNALELDGMTYETWLRKAEITGGGVDLVNIFLNSAYGGEARDASALFSLWYVATFGDETHPGTMERGTGTTGGAQDSRFVGGSQLVAQRLAVELDGRIHLSAPVRRVTQDSTGVTVVSDAGEWHAEQVIVAIPPLLASRIVWDPLLPPQQDQLFQRLPFGTLMKCVAVYDKPFWRAEGLSGMGLLRGGSPIREMFDNTPQDGGPGVLMGFLGGKEWRKWAHRPARERRGAVLRSFAQVVGERAFETLDYVEQDWTAEQWTQGGPTSIAAPGVLTSYGEWMGRAFGRVHWAGAEFSPYWNGFMDGAVRSGQDAAAELLAQS